MGLLPSSALPAQEPQEQIRVIFSFAIIETDPNFICLLHGAEAQEG